MSRRHSEESVARVARIYASNQDAARALGVTPRSFSRLCQEYAIETPYNRKRRESVSARPRVLTAMGAE